MSPASEPYESLGRAFAAAGTRWFVFGAQAAILHGAARFTDDVDVTVDGPAFEAALTRAERRAPR